MFGLYKEHSACQQLDTYGDGHYFYFAGNHWRMNKTLGANDNNGCKTAIAGPDTFLPTNWTVWDDGTNDDLPIFGRWVEDKDINKCASDYTRVCTPCSSVTINCDGQPPDDVRKAVGVYNLLPDKYSAGRPVWKHCDREAYLHVPNGFNVWSVRSCVNDDDLYILSAAAGDMRPDSHRNTWSNRRGVKTWSYYDRVWTACSKIDISCN